MRIASILVVTILVVTAPHPAPARTAAERVALAEEHLAANDTLAAIEVLRGADLESLRNPEALMLLGRLQRERGTIRSRLESQRTLERALALYPDDPAVLNELGLTYFAQTFYPDAVRCFKRAVELDPGTCIAKYKVGVSYYEHWKLRVSSYLDDAGDARAWLKLALKCDPDNLDAARRYVNTLYAVDRPDETREEAREFAVRFPGSPHFPLIIGTLAFEDENYALADSAYRAALDLMKPDEFSAYTGLDGNILGYQDLDTYEMVAVDEQPTIQRAFWINRAFDPTVELNERFLEHVYRVFRADVFFSHASPHITWTHPQTRGWETERGEISIKYGWPDHLFSSNGGDRWEKWIYVGRGHIRDIYFTDPFMNGNMRIPQRSTILSWVRNDNMFSGMVPLCTPINGRSDVVVFRDSDMACSVYLSMQVNADSIRAHVDTQRLDNFVVRARFFDDEWLDNGTFADSMPPAQVEVVPGTKHALYDVVQHYEMPFDRYSVASVFEDDQKLTQAQFRNTADARRFATGRLVLSDILFERESNEGASFVRGVHLLRPNPWRAYAQGQRVRFYLEIYHLLLVGGQSHYRISYSIHADPTDEPSAWNRLGRALADFAGFREQEPVVSQSFERAGGLEHSFGEDMAIDVDRLDPGWYRLLITVTDLNSRETATSARNFYKTDNLTTAEKR